MSKSMISSLFLQFYWKTLLWGLYNPKMSCHVLTLGIGPLVTFQVKSVTLCPHLATKHQKSFSVVYTTHTLAIMC